MKSIRADFVQRPAPSRRLWMACGLLAASATATAMWAGTTWRFAERQKEQLHQALTEQQAPHAPPVVAESPRLYETHLREMLAARSTSWPQALTALETLTVVGVTPVNLEFTTDGSVRFDVIFADYSVLLEYVKMLSASEPELRWKLAQSQLQGAAGPGGNLSATLIGSWRATQSRNSR